MAGTPVDLYCGKGSLFSMYASRNLPCSLLRKFLNISSGSSATKKFIGHNKMNTIIEISLAGY